MHNAGHHLSAEAGEARCSRSGACDGYAAFACVTRLIVRFRPRRDIQRVERHVHTSPKRSATPLNHWVNIGSLVSRRLARSTFERDEGT